ncbi:heterokaryon incompatibility protein-domain-containing protein [Diplogelasinospora grovesii]|uniref:Heterokaryon incompatibility protein-domain-containing protein n=1 Tax=Diplogelasinospora grovesii TaxID=303347 RepID=A0AAN6N078_9PEZI|nr:heterokaryon incompatibility protein-domain-containing protein [Diplogelasinospora grovesii]
MPPHNTSFPYPLLPAGVDAIRVLAVEPGDFLDSLVCTLTPAAFSDRPKYVALSYTWGSSYPDNSKLSLSLNDAGPLPHFPSTSPNRLRTVSMQTTTSDPVFLTMNNQPFHVGHNLYLALLHLRSPTHPISVWVDAICINQADEKERNQQVSLMSFIYTRATRVVAWLGTKNYPNRSTASLFRSMSIEWKAGLTQHFGAALAGASKMRCSPKPDPGTFARIAESSYWTRLWIVQEACLPRFLVLLYGSEIWTYEEFRRWDFLPAAGQSLPQPVPDEHGAMLRLLETRDRRYTDMMTLERMIERFARSQCSELRDKVYGLLGCANDICPFVGQDERADSLTDYINSLSTGLKPLPEPRRGRGSLRVDYSRSFYDIWTSVVGFVFFQANNVESRVHIRVGSKAREQAVGGHVDAPLNEERRISIVRTAGIVQDALGQKVDEESAGSGHTAVSRNPPLIRAVGYIAGEILALGPDCISLVASSRAQQDWISCWVDHYQKAEDLETLRRIDEEYAAKILDWEKTDVDRIRDIRDPHVTAWHVGDSHQPRTSDSSHAAEYEMIWADMGVDKQEPRICLGTGYVIALVPPAARLGDVIVRFWNCDAAIVMRPIKTSMPDAAATTTSFMLVGRADVAEVCDRKTTPGRDPHAERCMSGAAAPGFGDGSQHSGAVHVGLNFKTLQIITAYIAT